MKSIEIDFLNPKKLFKKKKNSKNIGSRMWWTRVNMEAVKALKKKKRNPSSDQRGICVFFMVRGVERIEGVVAVHPQRSWPVNKQKQEAGESHHPIYLCQWCVDMWCGTCGTSPLLSAREKRKFRNKSHRGDLNNFSTKFRATAISVSTAAPSPTEGDLVCSSPPGGTWHKKVGRPVPVKTTSFRFSGHFRPLDHNALRWTLAPTFGSKFIHWFFPKNVVSKVENSISWSKKNVFTEQVKIDEYHLHNQHIYFWDFFWMNFFFDFFCFFFFMSREATTQEVGDSRKSGLLGPWPLPPRSGITIDSRSSAPVTFYSPIPGVCVCVCSLHTGCVRWIISF